MRRAMILAAGLAALLLLALIWQHHAQIVAGATAMQRDFQNGLARSLRALKTGEGGAWAGLLGLCWGYGFVHAVGPGHGKFLVGAYGAARPVGMGRLAGATVAASLGQALTAVLLVLGGIGLFSMTRQQLTALAETTLTQFSLISILLIGLWLAFRGARRGLALATALASSHHRVAAAGHPHHGHGDHAFCASCGHAHAPSPQAIDAATSWRELASVILAIAIRPCSGAILLLVLTWQMNILAAGIAGAFAMAAGTACLTLLVAVMGTFLRSGALAGVAESAALRAVAAGFELLAGMVVALLAVEGLGLF
ncbi:hypothetical protein [Paracoccus sp. S3-43]|uniref:nickel/cobalt transporter n=1 Tax=Paracoccus sp. S3-43 TaxID=3030011 RepID=UPI0023B1F4F9|nr:hypothetical protein [Paracoccus sp. S3-43]WEF24850.1 hypothetical protein PXD02_02530 [Paracoccus sp. S3-43]